MIDPSLDQDRPDTVHYNDRVLVHARDLLYKCVSVVPCVQVIAVAGVAFDGDVTLSAKWKVSRFVTSRERMRGGDLPAVSGDEDQSDVFATSCVCCSSKVCVAERGRNGDSGLFCAC